MRPDGPLFTAVVVLAGALGALPALVALYPAESAVRLFGGALALSVVAQAVRACIALCRPEN